MSYPEPRYFGDTGEVSARFRQADEGPDLAIGSLTEARYLATGATTDGRFGLYRWDMGPNAAGAATHFHRTMSESFFVLAGTVALFNGERWTRASPGDFLFVPEGGVHGFRNDSSEPVSLLILFAPGAPREGYFAALAERAAGREFSEDEWREICLRHDNHFI